MAVPIMPGKTEQWHRFIQEINDRRHSEFEASRQRLGVRERTFFQASPQGDMVIVTLEGDKPAEAFKMLSESDDPFTRWFVEQVKEIHGIDLRQPLEGPMPREVADSGELRKGGRIAA